MRLRELLVISSLLPLALMQQAACQVEEST